MSTHPELDQPTSESQWFIDYRCCICYQAGTARFSGDDMTVNRDGDVTPSKTIFCCACKSDKVDLEKIVCYDEA